MNKILQEFFTKFLLPELLDWIKRRHAETGAYPTLEEASAELESIYVKNKTTGLAFLAEKGVELG